MVCELWKIRLDTYLDGELTSEEMRAFDSHVHSCPTCGADALARVQMKCSIQPVGRRFAGNAGFRVFAARRSDDLPRSNARGAPCLRDTEAPDFRVRIPGRVIAG